MHKAEIAAYLLIALGLAVTLRFMGGAIDCAQRARVLGGIHRYTLNGGCQIKELLLFNE